MKQRVVSNLMRMKTRMLEKTKMMKRKVKMELTLKRMKMMAVTIISESKEG
jgi:hypothetical protein